MSAAKRKKIETQTKVQRDQYLAREKAQKAASRAEKNAQEQSVDDAIIEFRNTLQDRPTYVCTSCHRLLYQKTVREMKYEKYDKQENAQQVVLHKKFWITHADGKLYICHTCHAAVKKGKIPAQVQANNLEFDEVPPELETLNELECHLISLRLIFLQLKELPVGCQKAIHGPAVNVPANLEPICALLPRIPSTTHVIMLKFKRRLQYKSVYLSDTVHVQDVVAALVYLKRNNVLYKDVKINHQWIEEWRNGDPEAYEGFFEENDPDPDKPEVKLQEKKMATPLTRKVSQTMADAM